MLRVRILAALVFLAPLLSHATAQFEDQLQLDGKSVSVFAEPLSEYLRARSDVWEKLRPFLHERPCSASWRGHVAFWAVQDERLWLVKVIANPCDKSPKEVPLSALFPGAAGKVNASWFTGQLVFPQGNLTKYVHLGYESEYERYIVLSVKEGVVIAQRETTKRPR